jgi:hypothetical protein
MKLEPIGITLGVEVGGKPDGKDSYDTRGLGSNLSGQLASG